MKKRTLLICSLLSLSYFYIGSGITTYAVDTWTWNTENAILKNPINSLYNSLQKGIIVWNTEEENKTQKGVRKEQNSQILDIEDTYNKYLNKELTKKEEEINKYKSQILETISSLRKDEAIKKVPDNIKDMINIEENIKNANAVIVIKLTAKFFMKPFQFKGRTYILFINPIYIYDGKLDERNKIISKKYKEELVQKIKDIWVMSYKQKWEKIENTEIYKALHNIQKIYGLSNFYRIVDLSNFGFKVSLWKENQPALLQIKDLDMSKYTNLFYIPERLKYIIDKKAVYFYIPIWDKTISNPMLLKQIKNNSNMLSNISFYSKMCYYIQPTNNKFKEMFEWNIAFCWIGKDFPNTDKDSPIISNWYYNVNTIDYKKLLIPKLYTKVIVEKRANWTIIVDILIMLSVVFGAYLFFKKVNIEQKRETITEKEEL